MKYLTLLLSILSVATSVNFLQAKPVLVVVDLNNDDQIKRWRNLGCPTYEFIQNTAIAEIDEVQLPMVNQRGFLCQVIDEFPWSDKYFIVTVPENLKSKLPGSIIWENDEIRLIKVTTNKILDLYTLPIKVQPLRKTALPDRFWYQITTKIVPLTIGWDPFIQNIVNQVNTDSLTYYIQRLQDFKTRLALTDSSFKASEWLRQKFNTWGYGAQFDSFYVDGSFWGLYPDTGFERNVVATKIGALDPSRQIIICGHFDAIITPDTGIARWFAPGADDNASGTAGALEAARIFRNYPWDASIKFIGWAAEELGLLGSEHYTKNAESLGIDIAGVVNLDMVGYMDDANLDCDIVRKNTASLWLSDLYMQAGQIYVPTLAIYSEVSTGGSDWWYFANYGYAAVGTAERAGTQWNPHYHDTTDLITTLSPQLYTNITKASIATIAIMGLYPDMVDSVIAKDMGDGSRLAVNWVANTESDIIGYKVLWGRSSGVYTDSHFVSGISHITDTLNSLMADSTYYIIVRARDNGGHESYGATEVTGVPRLAPLAPINVAATPIVSGIRIDWKPNAEPDLDGYRVYRRLNDNPNYDSMNIILLPDTTFTNAPLSGTNKYYYTVRAFDDDGRASPMSDEAYGRPITLDQGILIVDETKNWISGNYPHDTTQDNFYNYIMNGYNFIEYEYGSATQKPVLADLVPYSTVLWHADDYIEFMASGSVPDFVNYLDVGGKLWLVGWKPTANLRNFSTYPVEFNPGNFIYDYLKISQANLSVMSDSFQSAIGLSDYPDIDIDPTKIPIPIWSGTMRYIEAFNSFSPGENIYTIDMKNNSSPFEGSVCGVRYLGSDYKIAVFGFPLYFMNQEQARAAAQKVMTDFGELPGVAEYTDNQLQITECRFDQNVPNPVRDILKIRFVSPDERRVTIRLFDVMGRLVDKVFDGKARVGINEVLVTKDLAIGVYFVQLSTHENTETMKLILLK